MKKLFWLMLAGLLTMFLTLVISCSTTTEENSDGWDDDDNDNNNDDTFETFEISKRLCDKLDGCDNLKGLGYSSYKECIDDENEYINDWKSECEDFDKVLDAWENLAECLINLPCSELENYIVEEKCSEELSRYNIIEGEKC